MGRLTSVTNEIVTASNLEAFSNATTKLEVHDSQ